MLFPLRHLTVLKNKRKEEEKKFPMAFLTMEAVKAQLDRPVRGYVGWQTAHPRSEQSAVGPFPRGVFITCGALSVKLGPPPSG